jgi:hypothetical protein
MTPTPRPLARCAAFALLLSAPAVVRAHQATEDMRIAATAFLDSLDTAQRERATYPLTHEERETWFFVPRERNGIPFDALTDAQRIRAHDLLRSGLSHRGYLTATTIFALEIVLKELNDAPDLRDPEKYYVTVFATPSADAPWGWRVEGHHLSLNFTVVDADHVQATPSFFGSSPAEVRAGPQRGLRVLSDQEDIARALVQSLDESQRSIAVISPTTQRGMSPTNRPRIDPLSPAGISVRQLSPAQGSRLLDLVTAYIERFRSEISEEALGKIMAAGWENVTFAWAGSTERGQQHYFRVQGPTFLVEHDNTQGRGNHIHSVWRDFAGDFGRDVLQEHYDRDHADAGAP